MITKWKVSNFKSIREDTELDLGPLTIFAGANSSGKSTFIQSILLIAQTLSHKVGSRSVVLNGSLTSLGQFDDLKSNDGESDQITIKCTTRPVQEGGLRMGSIASGRYFDRSTRQFSEISCEISFDAGSPTASEDLFQIQPRLFSTQLSCVTRDADNVDQRSSTRIYKSNKTISEIHNLEIPGDFNEQFRQNLTYAVELDSSSVNELKESFVSAAPIGCIFKHFLPERIICSIDPITEDANAIATTLQEVGRSIGRRLMSGREAILSPAVVSILRETLKETIDFDKTFIDINQQKSLLGGEHNSISLFNWFSRLHEVPIEDRAKIIQALREKENLSELIYGALRSEPGSEDKGKEIIPLRVPQNLLEASSYLDKFFSASLKYLGPLRDAPKPLYPLAPAADPYDVGLRGEHTAFILDLHKNKRIRYIPTDNFKRPIMEHRQIARTLESAVTDWLRYLGIADKVESQDKGKLGHELKVGLPSSENTHDLTHVGVGVSQVLPILVMCLLAESDSTLVFEQPELHLHPKVQTLLGDFFLSMALSNKQCIVETHSEYLIDRIRFRIASFPLNDDISQKTKIYFTEKPHQDTKFREVVINEFGAIPDWPDGFFDESQRLAEEILKAALAKKRILKSKE